VFETVAAHGANIDMIVQNVQASDPGKTDISFTVPRAEGNALMDVLKAKQGDIGFRELQYNESIGKLSLIGAGMRSHPGVSAKLFGSLAQAGINIEMISTSEIRISVVVRLDQLDRAVRSVHTAFGLDSKDSEAVVYGGTGR